MSITVFPWSRPGKASEAPPEFGDCCGLRPLIITWKDKFWVGVECQNPECENSRGVLACDVDIVEKWEKCRKKVGTMKCLNCGGELVDYGDGMNDLYFCESCGVQIEGRDIIEHYQSQDEMINLRSVIQVIDKEIQWSEDHREQVSDNEADWFIKGLKQARHLIIELSKVDPMDFYSPDDEIKEEYIPPFPEISLDLSELPKNLRWLRKMREMTLKEAGEQAALSASFLSDVERGRTRPSLETLQKLAIAYKTPLTIYLASDPAPSEDLPRNNPGWLGDYGTTPFGPVDV